MAQRALGSMRSARSLALLFSLAEEQGARAGLTNRLTAWSDDELLGLMRSASAPVLWAVARALGLRGGRLSPRRSSSAFEPSGSRPWLVHRSTKRSVRPWLFVTTRRSSSKCSLRGWLVPMCGLTGPEGPSRSRYAPPGPWPTPMPPSCRAASSTTLRLEGATGAWLARCREWEGRRRAGHSTWAWMVGQASSVACAAGRAQWRGGRSCVVGTRVHRQSSSVSTSVGSARVRSSVRANRSLARASVRGASLRAGGAPWSGHHLAASRGSAGPAPRDCR